MVSGDITDAKLQNRAGSMQFSEEWTVYDDIIRKSGVLNYTKWLDMRGNHDAFNVPSPDHADNYYRQYSVQGRNFPQSYMINHRKPYGTYSFVGLDACPSPGSKRPLNFFGVITTDLAQMLEVFSSKASTSNQTFWFGHYPTSTIISPGFDLRGLMSKTTFAYFCGHLHTLMRAVPYMYAIQPEGFFELELADWRDSRFFRVVAVDNDLVSFVDVPMTGLDSEDWPLVIITNPKNAAFLLPNKEPTDLIQRSTHIRILAWSKWPLKRISISIDGDYQGDAQPASSLSSTSTANSSPLFVLPWKPSYWASREPPSAESAHFIEADCEDMKGNVRRVRQSFTLDGTPRWNFQGLQSFILHSDHTTNLRLAFYLLWALPFCLLGFSRLYGSSRFYSRISRGCCLLAKLRELTQSDALFYSLACYQLYVLCGPIFMGCIVDSHFGIVFVFGLFVSNTFLPESFTYAFEIYQQCPMIYALIWVLAGRVGEVRLHSPTASFCHLKISSLALLVVWSAFQFAYCVFSVLLPYGWFACLLSPGRLWLLPFAWALFTVAGRRPK
ncbi:Transmembrane protein 62 [Sparganum proliferum]